MEMFERIVAFILVLVMSVFFCSCGVEEVETAPPTPMPTENMLAVEETEKTTPTEMPAETEPAEVVDITLMFYTTPIVSEFTLLAGETAELWADVICDGDLIPEVTWTSSDEDSLRLSFDGSKKEVAVTALNAENGPVTLTLSCGDFEKNYTVYIRGEAGAVSIPGSGEAVVKDIKLMYFNAELDEFTLNLEETVWLNAEVVFEGNLDEQPVWTSSNEDCLAIDYDPEAAYAAKVTALSAEESPVTLTLSCAGFEKDFTVYIHPGM